MENTFNLFRLNCMMDDNKSKNYNSIIVSLIFELIYERGNKEVSISDCYKYLNSSLNIKIDLELFTSLIEDSKSFVIKSGENDVYLKLKSEKFQEIDSKVQNHSIEFHIESFLNKKRKDENLKEPIMDLMNKSIYENINSFTTSNIKSILPASLKEKFKNEEIEAFNAFLDEDDHIKNIALFNVFLKAIEFAIITSGKGVKQFTKDIFAGKEYCLDSNIIFRLLGIGGEERKESLIKLIEACIHQGIKFKYCINTYQEVTKKIESIVVEINEGTKNQSLKILEEMVASSSFQFNNGFIIDYAQLKIQGLVKSGEQYQLKLLADLKTLLSNYKIESIKTSFKAELVEHWQNKLFDKKKELNVYYTKRAAKVDAVNILLVRQLRGNNDYNYSDIKSFYLTTDRTLNTVMANENREKIAETILPSQLFILHNALSDDEDERDYKAFNKFLKRRTTEFKHNGKEVLHYIDELRNVVSNPDSIKNIIKAYSDKRYETSLLSIDAEPQHRSIKEFAETFMDQQLKGLKSDSEKYQQALKINIEKLPSILSSVKRTIRLLDIFLSIALLPISILLIKSITENLGYVILGTSIIEMVKFLISTKTKLYPNLARNMFIKNVKSTSFYQTHLDNEFLSKAENMVTNEVNIWK